VRQECYKGVTVFRAGSANASAFSNALFLFVIAIGAGIEGLSEILILAPSYTCTVLCGVLWCYAVLCGVIAIGVGLEGLRDSDPVHPSVRLSMLEYVRGEIRDRRKARASKTEI
jgi:hypothetical protein